MRRNFSDSFLFCGIAASTNQFCKIVARSMKILIPMLGLICCLLEGSRASAAIILSFEGTIVSVGNPYNLDYWGSYNPGNPSGNKIRGQIVYDANLLPSVSYPQFSYNQWEFDSASINRFQIEGLGFNHTVGNTFIGNQSYENPALDYYYFSSGEVATSLDPGGSLSIDPSFIGPTQGNLSIAQLEMQVRFGWSPPYGSTLNFPDFSSGNFINADGVIWAYVNDEANNYPIVYANFRIDSISAVPEPSSMAMLMVGSLSLCLRFKRQRGWTPWQRLKSPTGTGVNVDVPGQIHGVPAGPESV